MGWRCRKTELDWQVENKCTTIKAEKICWRVTHPTMSTVYTSIYIVGKNIHGIQCVQNFHRGWPNEFLYLHISKENIERLQYRLDKNGKNVRNSLAFFVATKKKNRTNSIVQHRRGAMSMLRRRERHETNNDGREVYQSLKKWKRKIKWRSECIATSEKWAFLF